MERREGRDDMTAIETGLTTAEQENQYYLYHWIRTKYGRHLSDEEAERVWQEVELPRRINEEFGSQEAADAYYAEMEQVQQEQLAEIREAELRAMGR